MAIRKTELKKWLDSLTLPSEEDTMIAIDERNLVAYNASDSLDRRRTLNQQPIEATPYLEVGGINIEE